MQGFGYQTEAFGLYCLAMESHGRFEKVSWGVLSKAVQELICTLDKSFQC